MILGMPFMFLGSMTDFLFPNFIGKTITALTEQEYDKVDGYIYRFLAVIVATAVSSFIRDYIFAYASESLGLSLRQKLYDTVIRKDISFFDDNRTGDILSRLGSDTQVVSDGLTTSIAQTVKSITILIGVLFIMFRYSWKLTLIVVASNFPTVFFTRLSFHVTKKWQGELQKAKAGMCSYAEETLANIRTVKAFSDEKASVKKYDEESKKVLGWGHKMAYLWGFFMGQIQLLGAGSLTLVCFISSIFVKRGEINIGTITAFLLYMRSFQEVIGGITNNSQAIAKIFGAAYDISVLIVSPNKVTYEGTKIIGDETEDEDQEHPVIALEDVEFHYPSKPDVKVLKGVSLDVRQNQTVAIVGSSGKFFQR